MRAGAAGISPARAGLEQRSRPILVRLAALPRLAVLLGALVWLLAGLCLPPVVGGPLLIALAAGLTWLLVLSWPVLSTGLRLLRAVTILLVVGYAALRLLQ